ncbi:33 kDa chaperonin [Insulibacter thermoxylanivorax]|uniref:33 kDa chaperonin n=1 Tax=Insulibacter thermoxylanivorax TaxID=2749268 RepID=A0A916QG54_9BACL|nr:Hsp33 family molecular chaperone HslO [Insulibacter thermoxylanivorax]GFR38433.1 33 kDa chaperonin [Insulibacter thermoxylanivorax]
MRDYLIRGTALDQKVRIFGVRATEIVAELQRRHDTWPTATAALGRAVAAGLMMGAMLKDEQKLTIQIKGNGPLGQIVVDANAKGEVRGYVDNPHVDLPPNEQGKLDVKGAVGTEGALYIIKDLGLKEPYRGSIPIISGELGEDFTYYFAKSEQTPSAVAVGVLVNPDGSVRAAGGFILQLLPGLSDEEISDMERRLANLRPVTEMLDSGMSLEEIISEVVDDVKVGETMDAIFRCQCSDERVERTLISMGREELENLAGEDEPVEVVCHFCNEKYLFEKEDLQRIIEQLNQDE